MKKFYVVFPLLMLLILPFSFHVAGAETESTYRLLFLDGTRSLEMSMRVQGLVNNLQESGEIEVETKTVNMEDLTLNPLDGEEGGPYDLILIVPPTIETGSIKQVWMVTAPLSKIPVEQKEQVLGQLSQLKKAVSRAFEGKVTPVGVNDDLIPAYFSSLFLKEGALR